MPSRSWQKIKQMLSNTVRLNFLKFMHILHTKRMGYTLINKKNNKCVSLHEIIRLIIMKMEMKMKDRSYRYNINRSRSRHGHKYSK